RCVGGERSSVNSSKQITRNRAANHRFWYDQSDGSVRVEAASGQWADRSFCWNTNDQTDYLSSDSAIIKCNCAVLVRSHADVELLSCRIIRLRSVRIPNYSPSAARRDAGQIGYLHLKHEV